MPRVLHILPHPGGGAEQILGMLQGLGHDFEHRRAYLTPTRAPAVAAARVAIGRRRLAAEARSADVVHVVGDMAAILTVSLLRRGPSVFGTQGLHLLRRSRGLRRKAVQRAMRAVIAAADVTACSSLTELADLSAITPQHNHDRLAPVLNGIALPPAVERDEREAARADLGIGPDVFTVVYIGQLEARKGPLTVAEAMLAIDGPDTPALLLVAGDGPLRSSLERMPSSVRTLGFRRDTEALLAAADVFVMPSEREGLSLAVLEAMGRGLPVVVSDGHGNPEAVGDAGLVVPFADSGALEGALAALRADPGRRASLGAQARRRVAAEFSEERYLADIRAVFERAIDHAGQGA